METWKGLTRTVAGGATEPCTTAEVKAQLRITHSTDDTLIAALIQAARNTVETMSGRSLVSTTTVLYFDAFPLASGDDDGIIYFPGGDVSAFTSLKYYDPDGTLQTLSSSAYQTDLVSNPCRIAPAYGESWPETRDQMNAVILTYTCAATVTPAMKQAVIMLACDLYEHPEAQFEERPVLTNPQFQRLINTFKMLRSL